MTDDWKDGLNREEVLEVYSRVAHVGSSHLESAVKEAADSVRHRKRAQLLERAIELYLLRPWRVEICTYNPPPVSVRWSDAKVEEVASIERRVFDNRSLLAVAKLGTLTEGELCVIERAVERQQGGGL